MLAFVTKNPQRAVEMLSENRKNLDAVIESLVSIVIMESHVIEDLTIYLDGKDALPEEVLSARSTAAHSIKIASEHIFDWYDV